VGSAAPALAQGDAACRDYTNVAVRQQHFNHWRRCGFRGARWNFDSAAHFNWCRSATAAQRAAENRARAAALARCPKSWCEIYADRAALQGKENEDLRCGFTGPRWSRSWDVHYDWCFKAKRDSSGREWQERNAAMNRCKREKRG
jgi:hypothetical protein